MLELFSELALTIAFVMAVIDEIVIIIVVFYINNFATGSFLAKK